MRGTKRAETKVKMLEAAGRRFRTQGYSVGVDGLAKAAGLTSGAFYSHFRSKAGAFREVVVAGLQLLRSAVEHIQSEFGEDWQQRFAAFYFGERLDVELSEACALPTFSADVARADDETRDAFEAELREIVDVLARRFEGTKQEARAKAWVLLALSAGGASMARAVRDPKLEAEIRAAVEAAAREG